MSTNETRCTDPPWKDPGSPRCLRLRAGRYEFGPFEITKNPHTVYGPGWRWSGPSWAIRYQPGWGPIYVPDSNPFHRGEPMDALAPEHLHPGFRLVHTLKGARAWCQKQLDNEIGTS